MKGVLAMEDKPKYDKVKYNNEFIKNNYDSLRIVTAKGNKELLKQYCKENHTTINAVVNELLQNHLISNGYNFINKSKSK